MPSSLAIVVQFLQNMTSAPINIVNIMKYSLSAAATQFCFDPNICVDVPDATNSTSFANTLSLNGGIVGVLVALMMSAAGAYKIMTSGGDPNKIKDGIDQIKNALLGLMLVLMASVIIIWIFHSVGVVD